ncbi:hypothetical protein [Oceanithermus sp.]
MRHPAELFFEDETLTEGLTDDEARDLLAWLVGLADEVEGEDPAYMEQLKRLGRHLARLSARWGVPVGDLIDLVELAWEDPDQPHSRLQRPMRA